MRQNSLLGRVTYPRPVSHTQSSANIRTPLAAVSQLSTCADSRTETFFSSVPQLPRMIHRATLMRRLLLPPTHSDFPHATLLHAICAISSTHTVWASTLYSQELERVITQATPQSFPGELPVDLGLAQAYTAKRAIDLLAAHGQTGTRRTVLDITQASVSRNKVLSDARSFFRTSFFKREFPFKGG
jgi:hypothetical protein